MKRRHDSRIMVQEHFEAETLSAAMLDAAAWIGALPHSKRGEIFHVIVDPNPHARDEEDDTYVTVIHLRWKEE